MGNIIPSSTSPCPDSRQVRTDSGPIVGRRLIHEGEKMVDAFQGIPYAKPPVGELRFKHPEKPEPWEEVKETKEFGFRGIQKDMLPWVKYKCGATSEDNLTLNVFSPVWTPPTDDGFPVLVFIHGGGFVSDSCVKYGDIGICQHLVTKDVVVVTLQYRLGYLGFWTTGDEHCPGNLALWDMTLALQWVQDNISQFNGNPKNVTLMGQSAGGASVDILSLSPRSRDLFHKVIPMAGNASCDWAIHRNGVEACRKMAAKLGVECDYDSSRFLSELRHLPASSFACSLDIEPSNGQTECTIGPRIDGIFIPKEINELRREAPGKPRMVGCCKSEGLLMMLGSANYTQSRLQEIIANLVPERGHPYDFQQMRKEILNRVLDMSRKDHTVEQIKRAACEVYGDSFLNIGCQQSVVECTDSSDQPVYLYSFDHFNPKMWGLMGVKIPFKEATHCTELAYIFAVGIIASFEYTKEDLAVLEMTTRLWTNFAKYGNPNGAPGSTPAVDSVVWLPATKEQPQRHLTIGLKPTMNDIYKDGRPMLYVDARRHKTEVLASASHAVPTELAEAEAQKNMAIPTIAVQNM